MFGKPRKALVRNQFNLSACIQHKTLLLMRSFSWADVQNLTDFLSLLPFLAHSISFLSNSGSSGYPAFLLKSFPGNKRAVCPSFPSRNSTSLIIYLVNPSQSLIEHLLCARRCSRWRQNIFSYAAYILVWGDRWEKRQRNRK